MSIRPNRQGLCSARRKFSAPAERGGRNPGEIWQIITATAALGWYFNKLPAVHFSVVVGSHELLLRNAEARTRNDPGKSKLLAHPKAAELTINYI